MNIAIVGLGVVGGSLAMGLQNQEKYTIMGITRSSSTIEKAFQLGLIQKGSTDPSLILPDADLVVLSIYPKSIAPFLKKNRSYFKKNAVLLDFSGIKTKIIEEVSDLLPEGIDIVYAHPMAGREKRGLDYASGEVNRGANFLITPTPQNEEEHLKIVENLASDAGFGRISRFSPQKHDAMIAYTSQLPHAMAVALVNSDTDVDQTNQFIGDSYRDLTRIAAINEDLWSELFLGNQNQLVPVLNRFIGEMEKIRDAVAKEDSSALCALFIQSTQRKEQMGK